MLPELFQTDEEFLQSVMKALNYTSQESVNDDVEKIKEWMEKQPHFPEIMHETMIRNFLFLNKGSVEKAKIKINNYYTMRSQLPEIFEKSNPEHEHMRKILNLFYLVPLSKRTDDNYRVFFYKACDCKDQEINGNYLTAFIVNLQEVRLREDVILGDIFIFDLSNTPFGFYTAITPLSTYKALVLIYQRVFSSRLKAIYIINSPPIFQHFLKIIKMIIKPKIFDRIHMLDNIDSLKGQIDMKILPKEYGGDEVSLNELQQILQIKFEQYKERFERLDEIRVDEKLRQKLENDDRLGVYGNFKKLEID